MVEVYEYPTREHWLKARRHTIGGSDAATILGLNPFNSPYALWYEKVYGVRVRQIQPKAQRIMEIGTLFEEPICQLYAAETERQLNNLGAFSIHKTPAYPWAHSTIDREILAPDKPGPGILEAKNTGGWARDLWKDGAVPLTALIQLQHNLAVTGRDWGSVVGLVGGWQVQLFSQDFDRNQVFVEYLMEREAEFHWQVQHRKPPKVDGHEATRAVLDHRYPKPTDDVERRYITLPPESMEWHKELQQLDAQVKNITADLKLHEARQAILENTFLEAIQDHEIGIIPGTAEGYKIAIRHQRARVQVSNFTEKTIRTLKRIK